MSTPTKDNFTSFINFSRSARYRSLPIIERVLLRINKKENGCWEWLGGLDNKGYGRISVNGSTKFVYRITYEHFCGQVPDGLCLDHFYCQNRRCVNPDHLEPVTSRENTLRGTGISAMNARKTHCIHGHAFNEENTIFYLKKGRRYCKTCKKENDKNRINKNKARGMRNVRT